MTQYAGLVPTTAGNADVIYIGYPKAASTFVGRFLANHPEITSDRDILIPFLYAPSIANASTPITEKPRPDKIHVIIDEKVAESVCMTGEGVSGEKEWNTYRFVPDAWDKVKEHVILDPFLSAQRLHEVHPRARVLLLIREQVDWLNSSYKHYMRYLPAARRSFADFCATPQGIACLQAGYFDQTIRAYVDEFGSDRVQVLRFEDIVGAPTRFAAELCAFIGIAVQPIPQGRENESSSQVAKLRRYLPIIDRLPTGIKAALRPYAARLPGRRGMLLSPRDSRLLRGLYAASNQRTGRLLDQLSLCRSSATLRAVK